MEDEGYEVFVFWATTRFVNIEPHVVARKKVVFKKFAVHSLLWGTRKA